MRPSTNPRAGLTQLLAGLLSAALVVAGCGNAEPTTGTTPSTTSAGTSPTQAPSTTRTTPGTTPGAGSSDTPSSAAPEEKSMQIGITVNGQRFGATLTESAAARDLVAQLPVTVEMTDHGGVEKTGPLPSPLSLDGQPEGADPDVGDLGYYAPGRDLVLYYGDQSYFPGIVVLGRLDGDAAEQIARLDGSVTVTVEAR